MALSPLPILAVIVCTLVFEGLVFGDTLAEKSFPEFEEVEETCAEGGDGFFAGIECFVAKVVFFLRVIGGVVAFFFNLITFNVPGAPWFIRAVIGTFMTAGIGWSVATFFRGN